MDDLVDQPTRRKILDCVVAHPGTSARDVQRQLGLGWGETAYHLGRLVRGGALRKESARHRDYYFPLALTLEDRTLIRALRSPTEHAILTLLLRRPALSLAELLEELRVGRSATYFHLKQLVGAGVIEDVYAGTAREYRVRRPERLRELLGVYRESWEGRLVDRFAASFGGMMPGAQGSGASPSSDHEPSTRPGQ